MASISMTSPTMKCTCTASASRSGTKVTVSCKASGGGGSSASYTGYNVHVNVSCGGESTTLTLNSQGTTWYTANTKSKSGSFSFTDTSATTSRSCSFTLYHNGSKKGSTSVTVSYGLYWTNATINSASMGTTGTISPTSSIKLNFSASSGTNNGISSYQAYVRNASTGAQIGNVINVSNGGTYTPSSFGLTQWPAAINLNFAVRAVAAHNTTSYLTASGSVYTDDIPVLSSWNYNTGDRYYKVNNTIYKSPDADDPSFTFIYNDSYYDVSGVKLYIDGVIQGTSSSGTTHTFSNISLSVGTHNIYASDGWVNSTTLIIDVVPSTISGIIQNNIKDISNVLYGSNTTYKGVETGNYVVIPNTNCGIKEYKWDLKTGTTPNNLTISSSSISTTSSCDFTFEYITGSNKVYYQLICTFKNNTNDSYTLSSDVYIGPTGNRLNISITYDTATQLADTACNQNGFYNSKYYDGINYQYTYTNKNIGNSLININLGYLTGENFDIFNSKQLITGVTDNTYKILYNLETIKPSIQIIDLYKNTISTNPASVEFIYYNLVNYRNAIRSFSITPNTTDTNRYHPITGLLNNVDPGILTFKIEGQQYFLAENTKIKINCKFGNNVVNIFPERLIDPTNLNQNYTNESITSRVETINVNTTNGILIKYDITNKQLTDHWFYANNNGDQDTSYIYKRIMNDTINNIDINIIVTDGYNNIIYDQTVPFYFDCREQAELVSNGTYKVECLYAKNTPTSIINNGISNCLFENDGFKLNFSVSKDKNNKYPIYYIYYKDDFNNEWISYTQIKIPNTHNSNTYTTQIFPVTKNITLGSLKRLYFQIRAYDEVLQTFGSTIKYFKLNTTTSGDYNNCHETYNLCFYKPPHTGTILPIAISTDIISRQTTSTGYPYVVKYNFINFIEKFCYTNTIYRLQRNSSIQAGLNYNIIIYGFTDYERAADFSKNPASITPTTSEIIYTDTNNAEPNQSIINKLQNASVNLNTQKSTLFIVILIQLKIAGTDDGTNNPLTITAVSEVSALITAIPTVSYRQNHLGINNDSFENDDLLNILGLDRTTIRMHTLNNECITIVGALIDCGTWDD